MAIVVAAGEEYGLDWALGFVVLNAVLTSGEEVVMVVVTDVAISTDYYYSAYVEEHYKVHHFPE